MRERITILCAEIDGNADLFHRVHPKFVKRIQLCIENYGNHVENIIYLHQNWIKKCVFYHPDFIDTLQYQSHSKAQEEKAPWNTAVEGYQPLLYKQTYKKRVGVQISQHLVNEFGSFLKSYFYITSEESTTKHIHPLLISPCSCIFANILPMRERFSDLWYEVRHNFSWFSFKGHWPQWSGRLSPLSRTRRFRFVEMRNTPQWTKKSSAKNARRHKQARDILSLSVFVPHRWLRWLFANVPCGRQLRAHHVTSANAARHSSFWPITIADESFIVELLSWL